MTKKNLSSKDFDKLYEEHCLWLNSEEKNGKRLEIRDVNLSKSCNVQAKNLSKAIIVNVNFLNHNLDGASFKEADLSQSDLSETNCLSIEALSESILLSTKLPENFSFEPLIRIADDIASKQRGFTRLYVLASLSYIFICLTMSDREILLREFRFPNPFFEFSSDISLVAFVLCGVLIVQILDLFLLPLTKDTTTAYKRLPQIFPNGLKLSSIVSYWTYRWGMDERQRLSQKTKSRADLDYKNAISYYFAFLLGLRLVCYVVALSILGYIGLLADYESYLPSAQSHILSVEFFKITKHFTVYSIIPLIMLVMIPNFFKSQGFYINSLGHIFFILYAAAVVVGSFLFAGIFALSVIISYLIYTHKDETIRMSFKAVIMIMAIMLLCSFRYGSLNIDREPLIDGNQFEQEEPQISNTIKGINLEKLMLENLSAKEIFAPYTNFSNTLLKNANFEGANLSYSNFEGALVDGVNFDKANLTGVKGLAQEDICKTTGYDTAILDFTVNCEVAVPSVPITE